MIVSIHQPNFVPWIPFFEKIRSSDIFILLRYCQFEKGNYQNRFFYRERWHTMSVKRGNLPIIEKRYSNSFDDWLRIKKNLQDRKRILDLYDNCISENLFETNKDIILKSLELLGIKTSVEYEFPTGLLASDRLIHLCKHFNANTYLSGIGGKKYLELDKFKEQGIEVVFQDASENDRLHILDVI